MKNKCLFPLMIVFALFCSGCMNDFAVSKLNKIAQEYIDEGDLVTAASRLEASVELKGNSYKTRYNLAVLYMDLGKFDKALEHILVAQELSSDEPAVYYVKANIYSKLAAEALDENEDKIAKDRIQMRRVAVRYVNNLEEANKAYDKYLSYSQLTEETNVIINRMKHNKIEIENYKSKYSL